MSNDNRDMRQTGLHATHFKSTWQGREKIVKNDSNLHHLLGSRFYWGVDAF